MKDGMKNFKDYVTSKMHWLILAGDFSRDIFISKPASGLFSYGGISNLCYLSC